jgi:hypothetical protein
MILAPPSHRGGFPRGVNDRMGAGEPGSLVGVWSAEVPLNTEVPLVVGQRPTRL